MWRLVLVALTIICGGCSLKGRVVGASAPDLKQSSAIEVLFNHRREAEYRSPLSGQWRRGDDLEQALISAISNARSEVLVAVQELSLPLVAQALIASADRGVNVRVVLENTYSTPWSEQRPAHLPKHQRHRWHQLHRLADRNNDGVTTTAEAHQSDAISLLRKAGIPIVDDSRTAAAAAA